MIPVIIGATGPVSKSFRNYLRNRPGKHDIKTTETKALLGIADILRKVLMQQYKTFNLGNGITFTINCNYRTASTLYTLEIWFVSVI